MSTTPSIEDVIAETLDVDAGQVVPDANLVKDLKATPEDFLQIRFELRKQLGVVLPLGDLATILLDGAPASWWRYAFKQGYIDILPAAVRAMEDESEEPFSDPDEKEHLGGGPCTVARLTALVQSRMQETVQQK